MYIVPGMKLMPQTMDGSCWYASAKMIIYWKMNTIRQSKMDLIPPELDAECRNIRDADNGIDNPNIRAMAMRLGLRMIPPSTLTNEAIESLLVRFGPLWVNGKSHIVVIAGINDNGEVLVYDPLPVNHGKKEWRSYRNWYLDDYSGTYTVKPGDTLWKIARRFGTTWQQLYNHPNNTSFREKRKNPNLIYPGDKLFIPSKDSISSRDISCSVEAVFLYVP